MTLPFESLTRAAFLLAELGFLGFKIITRRTTPFLKGQPSRSGDLVTEALRRLSNVLKRPRRATWFKVACRTCWGWPWSRRFWKAFKVLLKEVVLDELRIGEETREAYGTEIGDEKQEIARLATTGVEMGLLTAEILRNRVNIFFCRCCERPRANQNRHKIVVKMKIWEVAE